MIKNVYDVIELILSRPGMYLGTYSVSKLKAFLDGYRFAVLLSNDSEYEDRLTPLPFSFFCDFAAKRYNITSNVGWCDIILQQVNYNEADGLKLFSELLDEYKKITITQCYRSELSRENIDWLHHESINYKFRYLDNDPKSGEKIPIYNDDVIAVYKFALSGDNSWLFVVENENALLLNWYNNETDLLNFSGKIFGRLNWKEDDTSNISLFKKKLYRG